MSNISYHVEIVYLGGNDIELHDIIRNITCDQIKFNKIMSNCFETKVIHSHDLISHKRYISEKSMYQYFNLMKNDTIFQQRINPFNMLCPYLMENYYVIDHGVLVKKCLYKAVDHSNIVGIIDDNKLILNQNVNNYILSTERLSETCKQCLFVYVCMGQNCKMCNNSNIVTCMPIRKFINKRLNDELRVFLQGGRDENQECY